MNNECFERKMKVGWKYDKLLGDFMEWWMVWEGNVRLVESVISLLGNFVEWWMVWEKNVRLMGSMDSWAKDFIKRWMMWDFLDNWWYKEGTKDGWRWFGDLWKFFVAGVSFNNSKWEKWLLFSKCFKKVSLGQYKIRVRLLRWGFCDGQFSSTIYFTENFIKFLS